MENDGQDIWDATDIAEFLDAHFPLDGVAQLDLPKAEAKFSIRDKATPGPRNEIGYHAVRTGDNPGEHTIVFGLLGETIELRVAATSRDCYAQGALVAAAWLAGKPAGLYGMTDVLGL